MANEAKTSIEMAVTTSTNSVATALTKMLGHKLMPEEVTRLRNGLNGTAESENIEDLFADYALLIKAWNFKTHGPDITEVIKHVQAACRGLIPTGDGVIDESLTYVMGELFDLSQNVTGGIATAQEWQQLHALLQQTSDITRDIHQAPRVNQQIYEEARSHIMQAIALFAPSKPNLIVTNETKATVVEETTAVRKPT